MNQELLREPFAVEGIPCLRWGKPAEKAYLFVHGKMSNKESAESFARLAQEKGYQVVSFDLPEHGERSGRREPACDVFEGVRELHILEEYLSGRYSKLALFACSLGAYFSLMAFQDRPFEKCIFQSPIVDMPHLIEKMFDWFSVTPQQLEQRGTIETPLDPLRWDYYRFAQEHPVTRWDTPTAILYASRDELQDCCVMESFARNFHGRLTLAMGSEHAFAGPGDDRVVERFLTENV
jgi:pimeloyl-ACP methyl ester carboxylesterase